MYTHINASKRIIRQNQQKAYTKHVPQLPRIRNEVWVKLCSSVLVALKLRVFTIQNYQRDALNIIYSSDIITLLYMFRVSSTHLQEDIVVHKQHMVPSLSITVLVSCWYAAIGRTAYQQDTRTLIDSDGTICCLCTTMSSWRWVLDTRNM